MFKYAGTIGGVGRKLVLRKLGVSETFKIGDAVESWSSGTALLADAAEPILGHIVSFADSKGKPLPAPTLAAGTASSNDVATVTTDGTNSHGYYAFIDVSFDTLYSAKVSGTIGTTVDSELPGCRLDINSAGNNEDELLETTATRTISTPATHYSHGLDPNDSTRLMVSIAMQERYGVQE